MVGHETVTKPSRSDEVLDPDQQLQIANQVRSQFDSMVPKRPTKPNRSDSDSPPSITLSDDTIPVPELDKLRSLQSQSQVIFFDTNPMVQDEFVETEYYKELGSIDKQHHTIGSGFIKLVNENGEDGYDLQLERGHENNGGYREMVFRTNPATNDWIPHFEEDQVACVPSSKPNRSESS